MTRFYFGFFWLKTGYSKGFLHVFKVVYSYFLRCCLIWSHPSLASPGSSDWNLIGGGAMVAMVSLRVSPFSFGARKRRRKTHLPLLGASVSLVQLLGAAVLVDIPTCFFWGELIMIISYNSHLNWLPKCSLVLNSSKHQLACDWWNSILYLFSSHWHAMELESNR